MFGLGMGRLGLGLVWAWYRLTWLGLDRSFISFVFLHRIRHVCWSSTQAHMSLTQAADINTRPLYPRGELVVGAEEEARLSKACVERMTTADLHSFADHLRMDNSCTIRAMEGTKLTTEAWLTTEALSHQSSLVLHFLSAQLDKSRCVPLCTAVHHL